MVVTAPVVVVVDPYRYYRIHAEGCKQAAREVRIGAPHASSWDDLEVGMSLRDYAVLVFISHVERYLPRGSESETQEECWDQWKGDVDIAPCAREIVR
jgi:hypothetical protein